MIQEQESFEQVRRLLALKRHEIPPPGYYHHFSRNVILRIKAGHSGESVVIHQSWFKRFWHMLDTRPVWAGAVGAAVCGFFVVGAVVSSESAANSGVTVAETPTTPVSLANQTVSTPWPQADQTQVSPVEAFSSQTPSVSLFNEYARQHETLGAGTFRANFVPQGN